MEQPIRHHVFSAGLAMIAILGIGLVFALGLQNSNDKLPKPTDANLQYSDANTFKLELGIVRPGTSVDREITISNVGSKPWGVKSISSDCSCTAQRIEPSIIAPGSSGKLFVRFEAPMEGAGRFLKRVFVTFDDGTSPPVLVVLAGLVQPWATSSVPALRFGDVLAENTQSRQIQVTTYLPDKLDLRKVSCDMPGSTIKCLQSPELNSATISSEPMIHLFEINFTPSSNSQRGYCQGNAKFHSLTDPNQELVVPMSANVQYAVQPESEQLFFGFVDANKPVVKDVIFRIDPSAAFHLSDPGSYKISHDLGAILSAMIRPGEMGRLVLHVKLNPPNQSRFISGKLTIVCQGLPDISIPVSACVKGGQYDP